jgi:hypothetical protein
VTALGRAEALWIDVIGRTQSRDVSRASSPWSPSKLLAPSLFFVGGCATVVTAAVVMDSKSDVSSQTGWVSVAVLGAILCAFASVTHLYLGFRVVAERRASALELLMAARTPVVQATSRGSRSDERLVASPKMTKYHVADCLFVAGKPVRSASVTAHERAGRRACGVCLDTADQSQAFAGETT